MDMTNTSRLGRFVLFAGAALGLSTVNPAWSKTQIGMLRCDTSIGIGEILVRKQTMNCTFTHTDGKTEKYTGTVHQYGVEIGMVKEGHLVWAVFAVSPATGTGLLAGKYAGVTASAAAGISMPVLAQPVTDGVAALQITWSKAPCRFCGTGCGVMVGVKDGHVVALEDGDDVACDVVDVGALRERFEIRQGDRELFVRVEDTPDPGGGGDDGR